MSVKKGVLSRACLLEHLHLVSAARKPQGGQTCACQSAQGSQRLFQKTKADAARLLLTWPWKHHFHHILLAASKSQSQLRSERKGQKPRRGMNTLGMGCGRSFRGISQHSLPLGGAEGQNLKPGQSQEKLKSLTPLTGLPRNENQKTTDSQRVPTP